MQHFFFLKKRKSQKCPYYVLAQKKIVWSHSRMLKKRYQILILQAQSVCPLFFFFFPVLFPFFFLIWAHSVLPTGSVSAEDINEPFISSPLLCMLKKTPVFINFRVDVVTLKNCVDKNREKNLTVSGHNSLVRV